MKKIVKILLLIAFFTINLFLLKNDSFAQNIGDACTEAQTGNIQNCTITNSADQGPHTGCCHCDGSIWFPVSDEPCSASDGGGGKITNPVITKFGSGEGADTIAELIASALKIAYSVAGLILLAMLLSGGIGFMTAGGDKAKIESAQGRISSAIIGFVIFMSIFVIINFIAPALGLEFLQILTIEWPSIL